MPKLPYGITINAITPGCCCDLLLCAHPQCYPHDFTACPWLHPGERARRRDPRLFKYSSTLCPDVKKVTQAHTSDAATVALCGLLLLHASSTTTNTQHNGVPALTVGFDMSLLSCRTRCAAVAATAPTATTSLSTSCTQTGAVGGLNHQSAHVCAWQASTRDVCHCQDFPPSRKCRTLHPCLMQGITASQMQGHL